MKDQVVVFWFRRDLRFEDNHALFRAQQSGFPVLPIFIFDQQILGSLEPNDRRVSFIHQRLSHMQQQLREIKSGITYFYSDPLKAFHELVHHFDVQAVYTNHDYEPYAIQRDQAVADYLQENQILLHSYKDQVIFEKSEVVKDNSEPYTVFTPYSKKWKFQMNEAQIAPYPSLLTPPLFYSYDANEIIPLSDMGFHRVECPSIQFHANTDIVNNYHNTRDIPAITGTTHAGIHLRFGTISIRALTKTAWSLNEKYLNELIWREFYQQILFHFPHVVTHAFKKDYDRIEWRNNPEEFERWCEGRTGYPLVDAGMRELNATGWMHNRVRMVVASFLTKHLLIDWRWGEAYFAKHLLDFDLASNNGGWQWAAGSGVDAAPYFRVFNPTLQTQKFDPKLAYIRAWVPEFETLQYPNPMVVHEMARKRCLETYQKALKGF